MGHTPITSSSPSLFPSINLSAVSWDRVLKLDAGSANGRTFRHLLSFHMTAVDLARPEIGGLDYRRRISELRQMGIPVYSEPVDGKPYHRYHLPSEFVSEYWQRRRTI